MEPFVKSGTCLCLAAGLSFGASLYRGQLMVRMLDAEGNHKAEAALKQGDLKRDKKGDMPVAVEGRRHGNTIKVESIRARGSDTSVH